MEMQRSRKIPFFGRRPDCQFLEGCGKWEKLEGGFGFHLLEAQGDFHLLEAHGDFHLLEAHGDFQNLERRPWAGGLENGTSAGF